MTTTLTVHASRGADRTWIIEIPELTSKTPNGTTIIATGMATTFRGIQRSARNLAAAWLDAAPQDVLVEVKIEPPADIADQISDLISRSKAAAAEAEAAATRADQLRREAIAALRAQSYPLEAAGAILGVSYQRVQQLASSQD